MNPRNSTAAGKYFCEEYILTLSDKILLSNNIKVIEGIKSIIQKPRREKKHKSICPLTLPSLEGFTRT